MPLDAQSSYEPCFPGAIQLTEELLKVPDGTDTANSKFRLRVKTIVLSGGGTKAIAHVGALRVLKEYGILGDVRRFVATSAGSIVAGLYSIGYSVEELYRELMILNFAELQQVQPANLFNNLGMDNGERFCATIKRLISKKCSNVNITLGEIHKKFNYSLHFTAACLNTSHLELLNHQSEPDMPLWKAIRITTSIPFVFAPVSHKGYLYCDGGCIDNFPMGFFPSKEHTLGIVLSPIRFPKPVTNLEDLLQQFMVMMLSNTSRSAEFYPENTVEIKLPATSIIDFKMSNEMKQQLHNIGELTMRKHLTIVV